MFQFEWLIFIFGWIIYLDGNYLNEESKLKERYNRIQCSRISFSQVSRSSDIE